MIELILGVNAEAIILSANFYDRFAPNALLAHGMSHILYIR